MKAAYVDTSYLVAILFEEAEGPGAQKRLQQFEEVLASNLLEAELRGALAREGFPEAWESPPEWIGWVLPNRPLTKEVGRVLGAGHVRGADLWHLACALYVTPKAGDLTFLTLDGRQKQVAAALGFET